MTGLGILFIGGIAALFVVVAVVVMRAEDRRDPFGPEDDPDGLPPLGERPPEIAHEPPRRSIHELPPLGDAVWHQYPVTSPASRTGPLARTGSADHREPWPGTAAAAGISPPVSPPPLPGPAYAAANGLPHHFAEWESDTFVGDVIAIRDHGDTAGMEAEI